MGLFKVEERHFKEAVWLRKLYKPIIKTHFSFIIYSGVPGGFGNANAAGLGNGAVQNNQAIGTGTGIANVGPGKQNRKKIYKYLLLC